MKSLAKRQNNITLKEYIIATNIRRQATSRSRSKEKEKQRNLGSTSKITPYAQPKTSDMEQSRNDLIKQIKLKLSQLIPQNRDLVHLFNMVDRLVELFRKQLLLQLKQNQITTSLLNEQSNLPTTFRNIKILRETNKEDFQFKLNRTKNDQIYDSCSSLNDIPDINLLLVTKNCQEIPNLTTQQQTKTTINDHFNENASFRGSFRHQTSFFDKFGKEQEQRRPQIGNSGTGQYLYLQSAPTSCRNSQINFSIHSTIWNNISQTQNALAKFQEYKLKSKR